METFNFIAFVLFPIALLVGATYWAFASKRKRRFDEDARIPFQD